MIDYLLSLGFLCLGIYRLYDGDYLASHSDVPFVYDLRHGAVFYKLDIFSTIIRVSLLFSIFLNPSARAQIAFTSLLANMFLNYFLYPEDFPLGNEQAIEYRKVCRVLSIIVTAGLSIRLIYPSPYEFSWFSFVQTVVGFQLFWYSFYKKMEYDALIWFPPDFPTIFGELDYEQIPPMTCPEYRWRIFQWIGFALMAHETVIYCFAFCVSAFLFKHAFARHRRMLSLEPEIFQNFNVLWI
uniref:S5A_REDUCTASE domain-containing protein n=1 Tax=Caenorhabditis tropicalis TaxID=1561998 RepID=A0A1I7TJ37_9PELO